MFIPVETSHNQRRPSANNNSRKSNLSGASIDEQIRHLHKTRNNLLQLREQINNKSKKVSTLKFFSFFTIILLTLILRCLALVGSFLFLF